MESIEVSRIQATRKFWVLCLFFFCLVFLSLLTLKGGLMIIGIPLFIYLGASIIFSPQEPQIKASRSLSAQEVIEGQLVSVNMTLVNEGPSMEEVLVEDLTPLPMIEGTAVKRITLVRGETVNLEYTVRGKRGRYGFAGVKVTYNDHFDLLRRQKVFPLVTRLSIIPSIARLHQVAIRPRETRGFAGPIPSRQAGSGVDFYGIRDYQVGDSLRRINWKLSSRHFQDLFTNEFEQERIADIGLILDARQQTNVITGQGSLFEYSVQAVAALADVLLKAGHRVSFLIYGYGMERVYPGYGKVQKERIMRTLTQARLGVNFALESLNYIPTRLFSSHSQLIMVSPLGESDHSALIRLRGLGYEMIVISPNPVEFVKDKYLARPEGELAVRLAQVERELMIRKLKRAGIWVVDWNVNEPLDGLLRSRLAQMPSNHRFIGVKQ